MIFKSLIVASQVSAFCLIPTWFEPKVAFTNVRDIQTNANITVPLSLTFDWQANQVKTFYGIDGNVTSSNSISINIDLVDTSGKVLRPLYQTSINAKNGVYGADTAVVIPSFDFKTLPLVSQFKVTVKDQSRLGCTTSTVTSPSFTLSKGTSAQYSDEFFKAVRNPFTNNSTFLAVDFEKDLCSFTEYFPIDNGSSFSYMSTACFNLIQ